jgi:amidase
MIRLSVSTLALCLTLTSIAAGARDTAAGAVAALDSSLACIAASDARFNAVIALSEDSARDAARAIDAGANTDLPLAGMPVLLKDNIESVELPTTAGSLLLAGNHTGRDAPLVAQLRAAGALIVGKTNLSEWANFRSQHSSSGWSGIGGQSRNAVDALRSPCGSSSGSAVAVARGYVPMAVGTETSGSIVCPAAVNGVVGFKPTHGLVSGTGIVPLAVTQDTAGPIADSVATAARTLAIMVDPEQAQGSDARIGLTRYADLASLAGLRVGVYASTQGFDRRRDRELSAVLDTLREDGATIVEDLRIKRYEGFGEDSYKVLLYEFRRDIATYLAGLPATPGAATLDDLIAGNRRLAQRELQVFDQSIFLDAQALEDDEARYSERLQRIKRATREEGLDRLFTEHELDAIVGVTGSLAWVIDPINGDAYYGSGMAGDAAIAGNPHITLPLGEIRGLPLGISLYGERWQDHRLAQIAYRLEQLHPPPAYRWVDGTPASVSPACAGNPLH